MAAIWIVQKLRGMPSPPPAPLQPRSTYAEAGNQWYYPPLAGPQSFLNDIAGAEPVTRALKVLDVLSTDAYLDFVRNFYKTGLANIGPSWIYADINTVLSVVKGNAAFGITASGPVCTQPAGIASGWSTLCSPTSTISTLV